MTYKILPHQIETSEYLLKNKYAILALQMGTGKSLSSLNAAFKIKDARVLIVCPSYLKTNWRREVDKFFPGKIITTFNTAKEIYRVWDSDVVIISYSLLEKCEHLFEWTNFVIADEAHYLKNIKAKRTDIFHRLVYENSVDYLALLTGTPIKNRVEEFYSLLALTYYKPGENSEGFLKKFPDSITFADTFSNRIEYSVWKGYREIRVLKWEGIKNTDYLKSFLKDRYIRFMAKEVLNLKEPIFRDVHISEEDDLELINTFRTYEDEGTSGVSPQCKAKAALDKSKYTIKYVKDLLEQGLGPVVVFTDHVLAAEELAKGLGVRVITGTVPGNIRQKIGDQFQSGETKVLVATIDSFSTGVNLTISNQLVFNDYSWIPGSIDQAIARVLRMGQDRVCYVHNIFGSPQDYYIWETLSQKRSTISEATDVSKSTQI